jgi:hypothetical protein
MISMPEAVYAQYIVEASLNVALRFQVCAISLRSTRIILVRNLQSQILRTAHEMDPEAQIKSCSVRPMDSNDSDEFWFTTSDYTTPSTLSLADAAKVSTEMNCIGFA